MIYEEIDPSEGLLILEQMLLLRKKPPLRWAVQWSSGGTTDPVTNAWNLCRNPYAMIGVITNLPGYKFPDGRPVWLLDFEKLSETHLRLHAVSPSGRVAKFDCRYDEAVGRIRAGVDAPTSEMVWPRIGEKR